MNQLIPEENEILLAMVADNFQQSLPQPQENNTQLGLALMEREDNDPAWSQALNAEATRL